MSLRERFRDWLAAYLRGEELEGVTSYLVHHAQKHSKISFGMGFAIGICFTVIILKWIS
jgi:hypothetical protein